jgi:hypothetical protein
MTSAERMTIKTDEEYVRSMFRLEQISEHTRPGGLTKSANFRAAVLLYERLASATPETDIEERTHWLTKGQVRFLVKRQIFSRLSDEPDYRLRAVSPAFTLAGHFNPQRGDTPLSVFVLCTNTGQLYPGMKVLALRADKPIPGPRTGYDPNRIYLFGVFHPHEVEKLLDPNLIISDSVNP